MKPPTSQKIQRHIQKNLDCGLLAYDTMQSGRWFPHSVDSHQSDYRCHSTVDDNQNLHCHEDLKSCAENVHASGRAEACLYYHCSSD